MDYQSIYSQLVSKRQQNLVEGYTEKHHIIPRCMGGSDESSNLVALTVREHFIAHQLLVKIYPKESSLVYAANMMLYCNGLKHTAKKYEWLKKQFSQNMSQIHKGKKLTESHRKRISESQSGENNNMYGKTHTDEVKQRISEKKMGSIRSEESRLKQSASTKGQPKSDEHKRKISEAHKGKKRSQSVTDKILATKRKKHGY
jgi:hypothetical protein